MAKENHPYSPDEFEIFGAHKTREQIKAEEKARKKAQREALRREMQARREAYHTNTAPRRHDVWTVIIVLVAIVALGVGALALRFSRESQMQKFERDENRTTYFADADATPELADDGVTAAITEVFYTKGGYLCVELVLGNGTAYPMELDALEVVLVNGEEQQIAGGWAETSDGVVVPVKGTENYTFFISPEFITLKDDPLTTLGYTVNVTATPVTE